MEPEVTPAVQEVGPWGQGNCPIVTKQRRARVTPRGSYRGTGSDVPKPEMTSENRK